MQKLTLNLLFVLLTFSTSVFAQQESQFTQYLDNMLYYNPAYAGSRDALAITSLSRAQWAGIEGAPKTTTLSVHSPITLKGLALGASMIYDKIGPTSSTWVNGDISYTIQLDRKKKSKLSFGLKVGANFLSNNYGTLTKEEWNDPTLSGAVQNEIKPNFGAGVYYHSKYWFLGLSSPRIVESAAEVGELNYRDIRHYHLAFGGYFKYSRMLKIRPSIMLKVAMNSPMAIEASNYFIFYDNFWLGVNYRFKESIALIAQINLSNEFKIGYAFELSGNRLVKYNLGSHELLLSYDLNSKVKNLQSPRYF